MSTPAQQTDASSRALRTLAQNALFDVLLAVVVVVLPLIQAQEVDWRIVAASAVKTAIVTAFSFLQRTLEARRG